MSTYKLFLIIISLVITTHDLQAPEWPYKTSPEELFVKFRYDPYCPSSPERLRAKPELVEKLEHNFQLVKDCFQKMDLKEPADYATIDSCYCFAKCYQDPLAHKYMQEIAALPEDEKSYVMEMNAEMLQTRRMFIELMRWKAEEKYEKLGVEPVLREKLVDMIWENRYFFANFMTDYWIDDIIEGLPETQEIPYKVKQMMVIRYYRMREFLDKHEMIRLPSIELTAYKVLGLKDIDPNPVSTIRLLLNYAQDTEPEIYDAFFNELHLNKVNTFYTDILEGINIYDDIGLRRNIPLRSCYEKLLLREYKTSEQRDAVRACLELIMHACRMEPSDPHLLLAQHIVEAITYDDVDKTVLAYPEQVRLLTHNKDACTQLILHIWEVRDAERNNDPQAKERLIEFMESLI